MTHHVLLDTHAWAWSLTDDPRLSPRARLALATSSRVYVSPISFFEIAQKVRLGKWPEMSPHVATLPQLLTSQGASVAAVTPSIALAAGLMEWPHRDPFDRMVATTAQTYALDLVSADTIFDALDSLRRIW